MLVRDACAMTIPFVAAAWPVLASAAPAGPAATLDDLGRALTACFTAPEGSTGSALTVSLALKRDGTVLGRPRVTYAHLVGPDDARRSFVAAALGSLARCTPIALTPGLGGAVAGRLFTIRFLGGPPPRPV